MSNKEQARQVRHILSDGSPIETLNMGGSNLPAISSNGEINAHNNKEMVQAIDNLMTLASQGKIKEDHRAEDAVTKEQAENLMATANASPAAWEALGANIAEAIEDQAERKGFLRNIAVGNNLRHGEIQRVPMRRHEVQAVVATSPTELGYQLIRDRYFTPAEFEIKGNVRVSQLERAATLRQPLYVQQKEETVNSLVEFTVVYLPRSL